MTTKHRWTREEGETDVFCGYCFASRGGDAAKHSCPGRMESNAPPRKDDHAKLMWRLLPWEALRDVVEVLTWACTRTKPPPYGEGSWRGVERAIDRYDDALERHLVAWRERRARGGNGWDARDKDSGLKDLAHAGACMVFLIALDRPDPVPYTPVSPAKAPPGR